MPMFNRLRSETCYPIYRYFSDRELISRYLSNQLTRKHLSRFRKDGAMCSRVKATSGFRDYLTHLPQPMPTSQGRRFERNSRPQKPEHWCQ